MKNKLRIGMLALLFTAATLVPTVPVHAEEGNGEVKQGELALLLVNVLGLYRFLPAAPSEQEAISVLLANGIAPANGWEPDRPVVLADLAEVIVKALDRADEVQDPHNPQSWINYLASVGVPIDTIGLALTNLEPMPEPIAGNVFSASVTSDPLKKRAIFGQPDEVESGTDVNFTVSQRPVTLPVITEVVAVIPDVPPRPRPVTRD